MTTTTEPKGVSGRIVLSVMGLIAVGLIVLTAVLTWGNIDTTAKPVDSPIADRPLVIDPPGE